MAWTMTDPHGQVGASYGAVAALGEQLADVLTARQWRTLRPVFGSRSGDPFDVSPSQAREVASLLTTAAHSGRLRADSALLALGLAESANRSASAGHPWSWA